MSVVKVEIRSRIPSASASLGGQVGADLAAGAATLRCTGAAAAPRSSPRPTGRRPRPGREGRIRTRAPSTTKRAR